MKLDPAFIYQDLDGEGVLVPIGQAADRFHGIIRLNGTAAFLVRKLRNESTPASLVEALAGEYEGTPEQFAQAVETTLAKLREAGALIE